MSREFNFIEKFYHARYQQDLFDTFVTYSHFVNPLDRNTIENVMGSIVRSHAFFRQACHESTFNTLSPDQIDIAAQIEIVSPEKIPEFCVDLCCATSSFPYEGEVGWRLYYAENSQILILHCNHVLFDGQSAANFHKLFAEHVGDGKGITIDGQVDVPFVDSTRLVNYSPSKLEIVKKVAGILLKSWWYHRNTFRMPAAISAPGRRAPHIKVLTLSKDQTDRLIAVCRSRKVALSSLLLSLTHLATLYLTANTDVVCDVPVSLRRWLDKEQASTVYPGFDPDFGFFVTAASLLIHSQKKFSWDIVSKLHANLHALATPQAITDVGLLESVDANKYLKEATTKSKASTFELSNLGSIKLDTSVVDSVVFVQAPGHVSGYFCTNAVGYGTGLSISLTCVQEVNQSAFFAEFERLLMGIIETGEA
ncbi:unnamed protein product [Kuraishia capsulata CBS 1993]|uniref:Alcohol acetyltransferase n=1 Tax=Kuraishia capsulata CBS 1993 TaxID=1382522 RepID=W6MPV6_9ASCO|nr:uncharacterized protein KUCA_T00004350001 [Kuraishia capsulata CBS 1993]CDK28368.1 unnamed protein product [Kuraishia capsulata CBS 1993]